VTSPAGRNGAVDALRDARYRRLWAAGVCLNVARWMDMLVLGWLTLSLTGSPFLVGVAAFCRSAPMFALGPLAGLVADRFHRGRLLVITQAAGVATASGLAVIFATGHGSFGVLAGFEIVLGTLWALDFSTRRSVLYTLVGRARLTGAISLETISQEIAKMLGPLAGGLLIAHAGPAGCYAALALLYLVALTFVSRLSRRVSLPTTGAIEPVLASLSRGVIEAWEQPIVRRVLVITMVMNALVFPYQHMLPVFARQVLAVGPERLGLLVAADGLGALGGALAIASWPALTHHGRVFAAGATGVATFVFGLALSPSYTLSVGLAFLIGMGESWFSTMQSTLVLLGAHASARGRALGLLSACIGVGPFGALWIGFFADQVGAPMATSIGAAAGLVLMLPIAVRLASRPRPGYS
jgi:MFS family permease